MRDLPVRRLYGVLLSLIGASATCWLAATDRLALYIHPRYVVFTAIMSVVALALIVASFAVLPAAHSHEDDRPRGRRSLIVGALLVGAAVMALLVAPPSTLSVATAQQRKVNQTLSSTPMSSSAGTDFAHFRLRDWAAAIQLAADPSVLKGRPFDGTGFVSPVDSKHPDLFYLTRFVVTCCAVDAQPVGVPVYEPGWRAHHKNGSWVSVTGALGADPGDATASVVIPVTVKPIAEPSQPYEH
ncbi:TIGR03943 family putative permease subunit [Aeromicrobium sp. Root344]|uniref:TIGR03943 family putative permease subunit n=1 Tax=Aeromicrobium sp. Root344 TaxID=1736521 RepID=UPI0009E692EE|nr:TIGR03943 family protein [Aeromicrobium sp. Root344]